jgi:uncharacterized protein with GYD domain
VATFFMFGRYSREAIDEISPERTRQVHQVIEGLQGTVKAIYALLGEYDVVILADFPRMAEAMKASIEIKRATGISFFTTAAMPIEEFDDLVSKG